LSRLFFWVDHNGTKNFTGPFSPVFVSNNSEKYNFYLTTDEYSEFIIGEEYSNCSEGAISTKCLCEGSLYTEGYCYDNIYSVTEVDENEDNSGTSEEPGGTTGRTTNNPYIQEDLCTPDWNCSEWENCSNELQYRTCFDVNECNNNTDKPLEERDCQTQRNNTKYNNTSLINNTNSDYNNTEQINDKNTNNKKNKLLIIAITLLSLIIIVLLTYFIFKKKKNSIKETVYSEEHLDSY